MIRVKICGITNKDDALTAVGLGASALGFIFYKKSPRTISPYKAKKIIEALPPFIVPVGVFVNSKEGALKDIVNFCGITTVQLHGDESPQYCQRLKQYKVIKAFRIKEDFNWNVVDQYKTVSSYLFDSFKENQYGGSGQSFHWNLLKEKEINQPFILSGGLNAQNVVEAMNRLKPYALDVSSGVEESPGKKSEQRLVEFFQTLDSIHRP